MKSCAVLLFACLAATLAACEPPPVFPTADRRQNTKASRIEGELVVQSRARGNAVVLLYDAARPPPPAGTGRPLSFTLVPSSQLFAGAAEGSAGPFTAPFAFSLVAPGQYLLRGFIDTSPSDFIPWYGVTGEPNAGDVGGAAIDALTRAPVVITIPEATLAPATGVTVSFADSAAMPADRPAFIVSGGQHFDPAQGIKLLELFPQAIEQGVIHQPRPAFLARYIDDDANGVPDDANGDGVADFWPKVFVRKLADSPSQLIDENDLDRNGVLDASGADYEHLNPTNGASVPADGKPDAVVLAAGFVPDEVLAALTDSQGNPRMTPVPIPKLQLALKPLALDVSNPAAPAPLKAVPPGLYSVVVMQFTGQTWRLPNELASGVAPGLGLPAIDGQSFVLRVP